MMAGGAQRIVCELALALEGKPVAGVARASGLSRAGIYKALAAGSRPSLDTAVRLAGALGLRLVLTSMDHDAPALS